MSSEMVERSKASVLGKGRGIEEVIIFVRDLEAAKDVYRNTLGFTVWPPPGESAILPSGFKFGGADFEAGSLEWRAIDDLERAARNRQRFVNFAEKHEGALTIVLGVSSLDATASFLRTRGFEVDALPAPWTVEGTTTPIWRALVFRDMFLPADPGGGMSDASPTRVMSFAQYDPAWAERQRRTKPKERPRHPNTARRLKAVWMAVRDLGNAAKAYESVGLHAGRKRALPALGATGREITAGQAVILLMQPQAKRGTVASFLVERGEGIMGVSIEVDDVKTARTLVEANSRRTYTPYAGPYGRSILIPADLARGVSIELFRGEGTTAEPFAAG
jgi:catechol 2,3-dioxygenase-like lactoylglutathione lyase family enzyme